MATPSGPIVFNANTGSDTQASGLGPVVAVYGSGGSTTATSAVVSGIDTTGVNVGDLLWVQSSSGRQFSVIASVDSISQVTCDDVFDNTETVNWAIGGKRATLDNASQLFNYNYSSGKSWEVDLDTDQIVASHLGDASYGSRGVSVKIRPSSGRVKITTNNTVSTGWSQIFFGGTWIIKDLDFESTATGSQPLIAGSTSTAQTCQATFINCKAISQTNNFYSFANVSYPNNFIFLNCEFAYFQNVVLNNIAYVQYVDGCYFHDNASFCIGNTSNVSAAYHITNSIFHNNYGFAYSFGAFGSSVRGCVINNTSDVLLGTAYGGRWGFFMNNIFSNNSGTVHANIKSETSVFYNNVYYNNLNIDEFFGDNYNNTTITVDPFINASAGDFNLNNIAGGGATLKGIEYTL